MPAPHPMGWPAARPEEPGGPVWIAALQAPRPRSTAAGPTIPPQQTRPPQGWNRSYTCGPIHGYNRRYLAGMPARSHAPAGILGRCRQSPPQHFAGALPYPASDSPRRNAPEHPGWAFRMPESAYGLPSVTASAESVHQRASGMGQNSHRPYKLTRNDVTVASRGMDWQPCDGNGPPTPTRRVYEDLPEPFCRRSGDAPSCPQQSRLPPWAP